jgi:GxGYxYP putative glycoside hydrolase C-terminal domain/GxGYxY sequence motif in domain of unknown function N-terminal
MHRRKFLSTMAYSLVAAACGGGTLPTPEPNPTVTPISDLWVIDIDKASPAEQTLAVTLQGLVNKQSARVWIASDGMNGIILDQLRQEGTQVHTVATVWDLLTQFRSEVKGALLYKSGAGSLNVATSLCGPKQAVAVDETIVDKVKASGLEVLFDARGYDERKAYTEFKDLFGRGLVVEQTEEKNAHLRDFAVQRNAFTYYRMDSSTTTKVIQELGSNAFVYGWGGDEHLWVQTLSKAGGLGIAADWSRNLSALAQMPASISARPHHYPDPVQDGQRIVAFVMSDGDNIQWMGGGFVSDKGFWANSHRGEFNMTWEMAPVLAEVAPRVLDHFYRTASHGNSIDDFVTGPSGAGYSYHSDLPDRAAFAAKTAEYLRRSDLSVVSLLNSGGSMEQSSEMLERPEVMGVLYKDYSPYNLGKGAIFWHNGKPCISYHFLLWEPLNTNSPEGVAQEISQMPAKPLTDQQSYAIINVHAWSWKEIGGPLEAVKRTIDMLPPGTRVVTAEELVILLRNNFGTPVPKL